MLQASVTIFVCLLSHVRRICCCLPAFVRKSVPFSHKFWRTEKLIDEKHYFRPLLNLFCVPRWKLKLLILCKIKREIIERWRTKESEHWSFVFWKLYGVRGLWNIITLIHFKLHEGSGCFQHAAEAFLIPFTVNFMRGRVRMFSTCSGGLFSSFHCFIS